MHFLHHGFVGRRGACLEAVQRLPGDEDAVHIDEKGNEWALTHVFAHVYDVMRRAMSAQPRGYEGLMKRHMVPLYEPRGCHTTWPWCHMSVAPWVLVQG